MTKEQPILIKYNCDINVVRNILKIRDGSDILFFELELIFVHELFKVKIKLESET